jgi:hypothetical protein
LRQQKISQPEYQFEGSKLLQDKNKTNFYEKAEGNFKKGSKF